jgi:hypothetical protein
MTLTLTNFDATYATSTDGSDGVWLGIGFDNTVMAPTNVVVCTCLNFGNTYC